MLAWPSKGGRLHTPSTSTDHNFVYIRGPVDRFHGGGTIETMKDGIHPESYRIVVFKDMSNEHMFLGKSCANTKDTVKWEDGNEYPLVKLDISNTSHPFYTGKMMLIDTAGRVDKFKKRYARHTGEGK